MSRKTERLPGNVVQDAATALAISSPAYKLAAGAFDDLDKYLDPLSVSRALNFSAFSPLVNEIARMNSALSAYGGALGEIAAQMRATQIAMAAPLSGFGFPGSTFSPFEGAKLPVLSLSMDLANPVLGVSGALRNAAKTLGQVSASPIALSFLEASRRSAEDRASLDHFNDQAFALAEEIDSEPNADLLVRLDVLIERLAEYLQSQKSSDESTTHKLGLFEKVSLLVGVLGFLVALVSVTSQFEASRQAAEHLAISRENAQSNADSSETLRRIENGLAELMAITSTGISTTNVLLVQRSRDLHQEQNLRSPVAGHVAEGTLVDILVRDKKWVLVRAYDHLRQETFEGWIRKKYVGRP